ncbi:putative metal-dependent hydrolase [Paenibacillus albiflavus]|uniref:Putative metal-dependent hydrolase E0485_03250 n=1 Tax=Paenibacillus albiflavus TaxID=2545760 RepID=A0A4R4ENH4_9BACL|nr:bacillithiol transferase BstA [Paenibacillus albiflavus]TCZ79898.1 putative metal-dependent hydrolase [Paenibacillus albiflavus]
MSNLQYPIGKFQHEGAVTQAELESWIQVLDQLPQRLSRAVEGLNDEQLELPYHDGGWTIRQVVHHLADSHMNCYIRFKLALTEDHPTIKPYMEKSWAELSDSKAPVSVSISLFEAIHTRWVFLLQSMSSEGFDRTFYHPVYDQTYSLGIALGMYAWHGQHHVAHITSLRERLGI